MKMQLDDFYSEQNDHITISSDQASRFAKQIANDFNPIHDPDSDRFCVPGDLLFAVVLDHFGLSQHMEFHFTGMVGKDLPLILNEKEDHMIAVTDNDSKEYLHIYRQGDITTNKILIEQFTQKYVAFSGKNFPELIVPLMKEHKVMINPVQPLVIYQSMSFYLDTVDIEEPSVELLDTNLSVQGRKGMADLEFLFRDGKKVIGKGVKKLALRGLKPFEQEKVDWMVNAYMERKARLN